MSRPRITDQSLHDHVARFGDLHPPIRLGSVDRTINDPDRVRDTFASTIDYLARVELEVDRNVLELLTLLPEVKEVDRFFYQDVWQPQEIAHGIILDQLQQDVGLAPAEPFMQIPFSMKVMGALAHLEPMADVARFMYYLTGAATEREAVLAYSRFIRELQRMGETALEKTVIHPIKQQEPGHFAFYRMSAEKMIQDEELAPWQLVLIRALRSYSFEMVGTNYRDDYRAQMGGVMTELGFDEDAELARFAADIGRLEGRLLYAQRQGVEFPPYVLRALRDAVDLYREHGFGVRIAPAGVQAAG